MASSINFNTVVDLDLRAAAHLRLLGPPGQGGHLGQAARPRLPRGRLRRRRRGAAHRVGRAQLEGGRQGHRPVQLRRRPGPLGPRRLHAGGQPAHLGLRDQLRRPGRHHGGQGQPADAQADPPELGGGGHQRAVQLHLVPHAGLAQRRPHDPGRQGPGLGGQRRSGQLRRAVRAQRGRDADRRRVLAREGGAAQRPRASRRSSTGGRPATSSGPTSTPRTSRSGAASARTSGVWSGASPTSSSSIRAARPWGPRCSPASGAAPS